jgi:carnitine 3-dehydrogenase
VTTEPGSPEAVVHVSVVGGGVIGTGWVLHYLRMGLDVRVWDPSPAARERVRPTVVATWPLMQDLGLRAGASLDRLEVVATLEEAVAGAEVVQEAAPEVVELKAQLFAEMDEAAPERAVLLSSTSGMSMTTIQSRCRTPERTAAGHPFNPPYLVPLVEVVGGERTDPSTVDWAIDFYRSHDKDPIRMEKEVPAFIASRLQEAMWREALYMIGAGEATVEQIDLSIRQGPGLRWAITGPIMNFHLAGGPGGIAHVLDHFGPTLAEPWTRLRAPELTDELKQRLIDGCEREAAGRSVDELVDERDRSLVAIMRARAAVQAPSDTGREQPGRGVTAGT